jgi:hypothetical protein
MANPALEARFAVLAREIVANRTRADAAIYHRRQASEPQAGSDAKVMGDFVKGISDRDTKEIGKLKNLIEALERKLAAATAELAVLRRKVQSSSTGAVEDVVFTQGDGAKPPPTESAAS